MSTFPKRPASHVTGDQAVQVFISECDPAWVVTPINKDYGLDLRVEVTEGGMVTGEEFFVQVKGRKTIDFEREYPPRARVRQATINYWLGKLSPTLIAVVDLSENIFAFEWLQYSYPTYPRLGDGDGDVDLPLYKNTSAHSFRDYVLNYLTQYYLTVRNDVQSGVQSLYLTRVLFHVAALFRICARMIIEVQRLEPETVDDIRRLYRQFYTEFAAHDELLAALREGRFGDEGGTSRSRLLGVIADRLAIYDVARGKFFRPDRKGSFWLIKPDYEGVDNYLLPTLGVLQEIEEILFQALTLGRIVYAPPASDADKA
jgi:hypothetical protein